jgi:hypothetical protein
LVSAAVAAALPATSKYLPERKKNRGMSVFHDLVDWVGGYPFEVARPEEIFDFYRDQGFLLMRLSTRGGKSGCNEFMFCDHQKGKKQNPSRRTSFTKV